MELTIEKQFPKMCDPGSSATYFLSNKSWRTRSGISGKIFQERSVIRHVTRCGKYTSYRRNTTRIRTRFTNDHEDVVDWLDEAVIQAVIQGVKPKGKDKANTFLDSGRIIPVTSWRSRSNVSGKIFQERRVEERYGRPYAPSRFDHNRLTLDDESAVDWFTEENTFNPAAIKVILKQKLDTSTYYHEETRIGVGKGGVKDRRPPRMGIDMPCEEIGWKGREYYTDEEFFAWKKPKGLKVKDMARVDYNLYNRICKHRSMEQSVPM